MLSDHGQTQGATFKQRHGYGLDELVERSLADGRVAAIAGGDEQDAMVRHAVERGDRPQGGQAPEERRVGPRGRRPRVREPRARLPDGRASGDSPSRRSTRRHPELIPTLRAHPHIGWLLVRSAEHGAVVLGPSGTAYLDEGRVEGDDPLAPFSPTAGAHLRRTDGFAHVADIMVGSFYDPLLDEGCAFEELISFHGGLGGPQTRPFLLVPPGLPLPAGADHRRRGGPSGAARMAPDARRRRGRAGPAAVARSGRGRPRLTPRRRAARTRGRARPPPSGTRRRACDRRRWPAS